MVLLRFHFRSGGGIAQRIYFRSGGTAQEITQDTRVECISVSCRNNAASLL